MTDDCRGESRIRPQGASERTRGGESRIRPSPAADGSPGPDRGDHEDRGDLKDRPYGTLPGTVGRIVQAFKSITAREYAVGARKRFWPAPSVKLWQRNYYEHIIRSEKDLAHVREYIALNPARWAEDKENPFRTVTMQDM